MSRSLANRILFSWVADVVTTVIGFLGTVYLARTLGAAPLGVYAVGFSLLMWLRVADLGITQATIKRISEGEREGEVVMATLLLQGSLALIAVLLILLFQDQINQYIEEEFALLIAGLFVLNYVVNGSVMQILNGYQKVHSSKAIKTFERTLRVIFQVVFVLFGFEVLGLFLGFAGSLTVATAVGFGYLLYAIDIAVTTPSKETFASLIQYAKYSVLGVVKSQAFTWTDIVVMGFFLESAIIGVYQVSWTLAMAFLLFGNAMQQNLFPEISGVASEGASDRVRELISESFIYVGVFPIAGVVGAALLGQQVLSIYGPEFTGGGAVLTVLILVAVLRSYEAQIHALLDGLDRPDLTFRLNAAFTVINVGLNVALVPVYGAIGAAVASAVAIGLNIGLGWRMSTDLVDIRLPIVEIGKQVASALLMGAVVFLAMMFVNESDFVYTVALIGLGAAVYFGAVLTLSAEIRSKSRDITSGIVS